MCEEQGARKLSTPSKKLSSRTPNPTERTSPQTSPSEESSQLATPPKHGDIPADETSPMDLGDRKPPAKRDHPSASQSTSPSTPEGSEQRARQVIAVSASKGPAAFFNLARKFLVTDEMCDLSALEGAIVSAVDAAHLLERSKLASIVRYVSYPSHFLCPAQPPKKEEETPPIVDCISSSVILTHISLHRPFLLFLEYKLHTLQSSPNDGNKYHLLCSNQLHHHMLHLPWAGAFRGNREKPLFRPEEVLRPEEVGKEDHPSGNFAELALSSP
jgi:hypothetical protein